MIRGAVVVKCLRLAVPVSGERVRGYMILLELDLHYTLFIDGANSKVLRSTWCGETRAGAVEEHF